MRLKERILNKLVISIWVNTLYPALRSKAKETDNKLDDAILKEINRVVKELI